jgi:bifunctional glutamyl/prolyl-tRNA synthetase
LAVLLLTRFVSFSDVVAQSDGLCDPCVANVKAGEVIQLERKGFFRCDVAYGGSADKPAVLFLVPDGKGKKQPASGAAAAAKK